ncbi:aspartate carbamoyltransferase regulatory subunit [Candidatus Woesearchaeota archaeon]|nr:aspartate carbamoyltransferase regulatory subunit [Candidatus Woesearchaeota archaeon]
MRAYRVYAIEKGTVIDHIPAGKALKVVEILKLDQFNKIVTVGMNLESKKLVRKDIVKIENKNLSKQELNKIALIAPKVTINIIKNHKVDEKFKIEIPDFMENLVICPNPNCISRNEPTSSKFYKTKEKPLTLKCHYCEKGFKDFKLK